MKYLDYFLIIELYKKSKLSSNEIAKIMNCSNTTIYNVLKDFNIKIRTASEAGYICNNKPEFIKMLKSRIGSKNHMFGRKRSKETKQKISESHLGEKNPMYGVRSPNYIDGRTFKKYYCKCGKKICFNTYFYGKGQCHTCGSLGKVHTEETKQKMSDNHVNNTGDKHPNWKGGITSLTGLIRGLDEYHNWRKRVFKRDNYTCQECGATGNIEAHHIKEFNIIFQEFLQLYSQFSPIEDKETLIRLAMTYEPFWDLTNGKTLCKNCHKLTNNYGNKKNVNQNELF